MGAVVGAGFASGQEIYEFFSRYGTWGTLGIWIAGLLFWLLGRRALLVGARGASTLPELLQHTYPRPVVRWLDSLSSALLAVGLVAVAAAGGGVLALMLGIPAFVGAALTLAAVLVAGSRGSTALLGINLWLVPTLLLITVGVAAASPYRWTASPLNVHGGAWWLSASLYVSYNLFTGLVVLLGLGESVGSAPTATLAAGLGALVLTVLALAIHGAILGAELSRVADLPLLVLAHHVSGVWWAADALALYAALFTTGVAETYALTQRYGPQVVWWGIILWPLSWMGFADWVRIIYPVMGVAALTYVWPLLRRWSRPP